MRDTKPKTIIKAVLIGIGCFLGLLFEGWWPLNARLFGLMPDMAICLTVLIATRAGWKKGCVIGLILGLVHDALLASTIYADPLACMLIGFLVGNLFEQTKQQMGKQMCLLVLVAEVSAHTIRILGELLIQSRTGVVFTLFVVLPIQVLLTLSFTLVSLFISHVITTKKHKEEKRQQYQTDVAAER